MFIKRPGNGRARYALIDNEGKTVDDERIDVVNRDLKAGVARDELESRMRLIKASFRVEFGPLDSNNAKLVAEYQKQLITSKPNLKDHYSLHRRAIRSIEALGKVTIKDATQFELLKAIKHITHEGRRYHVIGGINTLLRVAGRDLRLTNHAPSGGNAVDYIDINNLILKIDKITEPDYADLLGTYAATGARWGELPAGIIQGNSIHINSQIGKNGVERGTKNGKGRRAPIIPDLIEYVLRYNALPKARKLELRLLHPRKVLKVTQAILELRIHDLRHCYAVAWAKQGKPISKIALWIGDTESVCYKHYSRYQPSDEELEREVAAWKK